MKFVIDSKKIELQEDQIIESRDRVRIVCSKGSFAVPVLLENQPKGYVFSGKIDVTADTLFHTKEGAAGRSIVENLPYAYIFTRNVIKGNEQSLSTEEKEQFKGYLKECLGSGKKNISDANINCDDDEGTVLWASKPNNWLLVSGEKELVIINHNHMGVEVVKDDKEYVNAGKEGVIVAKDNKVFSIGRKGKSSLGNFISKTIDTALKNANFSGLIDDEES